MVEGYYTINEIDDVKEYFIYILPFNSMLGFPQKFYVRLVNDLFIIRYKINAHDDSFIMEIRRSVDEVMMFHGKIVEDFIIGVKTPETGIVDYVIVPKILSREKMEVWLMPLNEMFVEV